MRYFLNCARDVVNLLRTDTGRLAKRKLLQLYLRVSMKNWLEGCGFLKEGLLHEELFGYKMACLDYKTLFYLIKEIFLRQEYFFETEKLSPLIIDCGSNMGIAVLYFKVIYPEARIIAFEPSEVPFDLLRRNVQSFKHGDITIHNLAVSDQKGTIPFYYEEHNPTSLRGSVCKERASSKRGEVEAVRLSDYINEPVDFLKIDVEGAEHALVKDLVLQNKLYLISQFVMEYHHHITENDDKLSGMLRILEEHGFGYMLQGYFGISRKKGSFQDLLIYGYRQNEAMPINHSLKADLQTEGPEVE